jgi:hypothetical protein
VENKKVNLVENLKENFHWRISVKVPYKITQMIHTKTAKKNSPKINFSTVQKIHLPKTE